MKNIFVTIVLSTILSGCSILNNGLVATFSVPLSGVEVVYEPSLVIGGYYLGYYDTRYGYWTGRGWDRDFYRPGHYGYGHYYRGAPREAYGVYQHNHYSRPLPRPNYDTHRNGSNHNDRGNHRYHGER